MGAFSKLKTHFNGVRQSLLQQAFVDVAGSDVVFVAGSGRSGTSWLANVCNVNNDFRYLFEPLNPSNLSADTPVSWALALDAESSVMDAILTGKVSNQWVNSRNRRFFAQRRLIKEIRSNLMLPWISKHYPKTKIVMILRNPLAVAASRKSLAQRDDHSKWVWLPSLDQLLNEPIIKASLTDELYGALSAQVDQGIVMETVADWCINNLLMFDEPEQQNWHIVYYENLVNDGARVATRLLEYLGVNVTQSLEKALSKKSETSRSSLVSQWEGVLTSDEIESATQLLNLFGVNRVYTNDWQPITNQQRAKVNHA